MFKNAIEPVSMSSGQQQRPATGASVGAGGGANISLVPKKDKDGKNIPNTVDGTLVRIRLFDDRERVLFFKVCINYV